MGIVQDSLLTICVYRDQTLNFLNNGYCIKVQFYGAGLAMILNVAMISGLLNDCTNRNNNLCILWIGHICLYACSNWAPWKNTLCTWPPSINMF